MFKIFFVLVLFLFAYKNKFANVFSNNMRVFSFPDQAHNKARLELMKSIPEKFRNRTFQLKSTDDPVLGPCNSSQDKANEAVFEGSLFSFDSYIGGRGGLSEH